LNIVVTLSIVRTPFVVYVPAPFRLAPGTLPLTAKDPPLATVQDVATVKGIGM
jgi:hypothetical protein